MAEKTSKSINLQKSETCIHLSCLFSNETLSILNIVLTRTLRMEEATVLKRDRHFDFSISPSAF